MSDDDTTLAGMTFDAEGLPGDQYETTMDTLMRIATELATDYYQRFEVQLMKHAKLIARMSEWQYRRLRERLMLGRIHRIGNVLDKVQMYGRGEMAAHLVTKGITADTFKALNREEQEQLNSGYVALKTRGDVVRKRASQLTDREIRKVVRSANCKGGAALLAPDKQNTPRERQATYYKPASMSRSGSAVVVACERGNERVLVRFTRANMRALLETHGRALDVPRS